jgi:REP element-mobilizing transposase RayT
MPDHVHILIGLKPNKALSDLVRDIKANQDSLMKSLINGKFEWQTDLSIHLQPFTID